MSAAAILMLCLGLAITWGGALVCMRLAMKSRRK